jgi:PAS domain S-box-containing protein
LIDETVDDNRVALLDGVDVGMVWVDPAVESANVNRTAAKLLGLTAGVIPASEFAETVAQLADRSLDRSDAQHELRLIEGNPAAELKTTWRFPDDPTHLGVVSKPAPYPLTAGRIWAFYDNSALAEAIETANRAAGLLRSNADAMLDPQVLVEGVRSEGRIVDLVYRDVNRATCEYLGLSRAELVDHSLLETLPNLVNSGLFAKYSECAETGEPVVLDGFPYLNELLGNLRYYDIRAAQASPYLISLTWRDVTERIEWEQQVALSEARFRLLAENVADVVVRIIDGKVSWISNSVENALNAPPEYWIGKKVIDFVAPEERDAYRSETVDLADGGTSLGRLRILDADGVAHWVHLHAKPFHEADGTPNGLVASFRVIDEEVAAEQQAQDQIAHRDAQNRSLTRRFQEQKDRLLAELQSAARYVESILPGDLDGPVRVTSRYVPSRHLGGDSYDYHWVDHDHLVFYLLDVSGHGVESAMLSVSVHNLVRSGSLSAQKLLQPTVVLAELNRLFQMDQHDGNYFTMWYGAYQRSTRRLRFACAGHPPALALVPRPDGGVTAKALTAAGLPIGMFEETQFATGTYLVAPNTTIVLYSDGAFELDPEAGKWDPNEFTQMCIRMAESPDWSVDGLIAELAASTSTGFFDDDCTVVRLNFD